MNAIQKMASTKVGDKDESISGDDASVTPFHGPDRGSEYEHVLTEILDNNLCIKKAIKDCKIKTLRQFFDVCKDPDKINALKWKEGSQDLFLKDELKQELEMFPYFVNDLQNDYGKYSSGRIPLFGIERSQFEGFLDAGVKTTYEPDKAWEAQQQRDAVAITLIESFHKKHKLNIESVSKILNICWAWSIWEAII